MINTYRKAGVNIEASDLFKENIKSILKHGKINGSEKYIGNFGGIYELPSGYKNPVLIASTDGVGTKVKIAAASGIHNTVGEDLVNHCVNDIAVCGAIPLFFLDYLAFGRLNINTANEIIKGIITACRKNNVRLIGGETAEMPDLYRSKDYDIAGTVVGIAEKKNIPDKSNVKRNDVLIGVCSNGLHTNGYSLARKVLLKKYKLDEYIPELRNVLYKELLRIHKSYLKAITMCYRKGLVKIISHITGGGIVLNTKRVIPDNLKISINWDSWKIPAIFRLIQKTGKIDDKEMRRVFNLGIGLVMICSGDNITKVQKILKSINEKNYIIGEIY